MKFYFSVLTDIWKCI